MAKPHKPGRSDKELLNGLLEYSRVQTRGKDFEKIILESVVEKVIANLRLLIEERNAEISFDSLPSVYADENQLIQLMQNLIENAIRFCKNKPVIRISEKIQDKLHVITVHDNGIGIEPQYYERVFRIFQRLHLRDEYKGTGIGLAICKRIVERHGGEIWVNSVPGKGSDFSFSIPQKQM